MNKKDIQNFQLLIDSSNTILVIQPDNPDGDSIGSAIALEEIFHLMGKDVHLYSAVDISRYLRYIKGWDRISNEMPSTFDCTIMVDNSNPSLFEMTFKNYIGQISKKSVAIIDHHTTTFDMEFETINLFSEEAASTSEVIFSICETLNWEINALAAEPMAIALLSDTLGLTTESVTEKSVRTLYELVKRGVVLADIDQRRREFGKRSIEIMRYKAELIQRIEFYHENTIASVIIPWGEIEEYSEQYNPSQLFIEEAMQIESVEFSVAFKVYDNRITAKIRSHIPIANKVAEQFGGGGHPKSSGCKVQRTDIDEFKNEFIHATIAEIKKFKSL